MVTDYVDTKYAIVTVTGTATLHIALLIVSVHPDDEAIVPSLSFIAPVSTIRCVGAWPVFIDADPKYWQMDSQKFVSFLE